MINIDRKDIIWNYAATFLKIAASALLLPFILRMMPSEMVGIWTVFITITAFASLLDFGFCQTFTRNVTYVFSGVSNLKAQGFETVSTETQKVDYGLLKGMITAMRWIYLRSAIILLILLATLGTWYINSLLQNYKGDRLEVYIAWVILCIINTYNLYTLYYDSLLQGKGLIKRSKQIVIIGQIVYLSIATLLIIKGYGLISIVSAQFSSVIIVRWLSYYSFFTSDIKLKLKLAIPHPQNGVLNAIYPNAIKIGLTSLGGFMVLRSAIIIGSLYLPLEEIASYGVTMQLITIISALSTIYTYTFLPRIVQLRVEQNKQAIKRLYLNGLKYFFLTYLIGGAGILIFGEMALNFIGSYTHLILPSFLILAIITSFLESNHALAGVILLTKNYVPFLKASLISGGATVILLLLFFKLTDIGLLSMIVAPAIAQLSYQNWKWPLVLIQDLEIRFEDLFIGNFKHIADK